LKKTVDWMRRRGEDDVGLRELETRVDLIEKNVDEGSWRRRAKKRIASQSNVLSLSKT